MIRTLLLLALNQQIDIKFLCSKTESKSVNIIQLAKDGIVYPKYYNACNEQEQDNSCSSKYLTSINQYEDQKVYLCIPADFNNNCKSIDQYTQVDSRYQCQDSCKASQFYYEDQQDKKCLRQCQYYYYKYDENINKCTTQEICDQKDINGTKLYYLEGIKGKQCIESCPYYYYQHTSQLQVCTTSDYCNEKANNGTKMIYISGKQCKENCSDYTYKDGTQKNFCVSYCDNTKTSQGKELYYADTKKKECVESCYYHWFMKQENFEKTCTTDITCSSAKNSRYVVLRFLNTSDNQCLQSCPTKYKFEYYRQGIDVVTGCTMNLQDCMGSITQNGTKVDYIDRQSGTCVEKCELQWWYQKLNTSKLFCLEKEYANCQNLLEEKLYYTSINVDDKQCIPKQVCLNAQHYYTIKDDICYYYKHFNQCSQFQEIEQLQTFITQSTTEYQCVENCNEEEYYYKNNQQNNQKICVLSCNVPNYTTLDLETRQCIKNQESQEQSKNNQLGIIIGTSVGGTVILIGIIVAVICVVNKKKPPVQNETKITYIGGNTIDQESLKPIRKRKTKTLIKSEDDSI